MNGLAQVASHISNCFVLFFLLFICRSMQISVQMLFFRKTDGRTFIEKLFHFMLKFVQNTYSLDFINL